MRLKLSKRQLLWHCLFVALTILMGLTGAMFFTKSYIQFGESIVTFWSSIIFYFTTIFNIIPSGGSTPLPPSITVVPELPAELPLPQTSVGFTDKLAELGQTLISSENFSQFFGGFFNLLNIIATAALIVLPFLFLFVRLVKRQLSKPNNNYNVDTKPLLIFKKACRYTYYPVKKFIVGFNEFASENERYKKLWFFIWIFNLNLPAMIINLLAYYLYFTVSLDFLNLYSLFVQLILNIFTPIRIIPAWIQMPCYIIIAFKLIFIFRRNYALNVLRRFELRIRSFIDSLPISTMIVGSMGKKKTTTLTDIALSQSVMFRNKAFELILENDLKFPNFPWINFELELKRLMDEHSIYNLAGCREYIRNTAKMFKLINTDALALKCWRRRCRKKPFKYPDFCFGYDYNKYGFFYDNKLEEKTIFDILENYARLYFIYIMESSLLLSNYSVREDCILNDQGNFPIWNTDFFARDSRLLEAYSRHAHILDFDALRLGKKVLEHNKKSDSFDFGIVLITEAGKERGNQNDTKGEDKNATEANRLNDGFNRCLKMIRHSATVDNYPFARVFMDEQRPESMGADVRSLCELIHIRDTSERKLPVPFFFIEELLHSFLFSKFEDFYIGQRFNRGDNSLILYLFKNLTALFHSHYTRIYNLYSYYTLDIETERGTQDSGCERKKYYIMPKKIYSKRFSTDCFSDFFSVKTLSSFIGLSDIPEYQTVQASMDELQSQNSFFINDLVSDTLPSSAPAKPAAPKRKKPRVAGS